jgi:hypothetical protein
MMKKGIAALMVCALSGCASLMYPYANLSPEKAGAEIIKAESPQTQVTVYPAGLGISATIFDRVAASRIKAELGRYCSRTDGTVIPFADGAPGFLCYSFPKRVETFAVRSAGDLTVLEKHADDGKFFDATVADWGYVSIEHQNELAKQAREKAVADKQEQQHRDAYKAKHVGARVCQDQKNIRYQGTVEQVNGDQVKVFVERVGFIGTPGLRPSGFQQQYYWVNSWDVYECE